MSDPLSTSATSGTDEAAPAQRLLSAVEAPRVQVDGSLTVTSSHRLDGRWTLTRPRLDADDARRSEARASSGAPSARRVPALAASRSRDTSIEPAWAGEAEGLTARESEILVQIVAGHSNAHIAAHSFISINSVKSIIRTAYRRIGVQTRTQAVLWGVDHGFRAEPAADGPAVPEQAGRSGRAEVASAASESGSRCSTPTESEKVVASRAAAEAATHDAEVAWERLTLAIETSECIEEHREALAARLAQQVYAWAVYHGTFQDAEGTDD